MADTQVHSDVVEFRGCENLVYAEVTDDRSSNYETGIVKSLAPVAQIQKNVETSTAKKWYDNKAMITIRSEGSDEVTLVVPALDLATLATLTGKKVDGTTGAFLDTPSKPKMFAIGYKILLTDGTFRYVWRLKGSFSIPDEEANQDDDGTDSNNQSLTFSGDFTVHKFEHGGEAAKAVVIDERDDKCDLSTFFSKVQTPDTISELVKQG